MAAMRQHRPRLLYLIPFYQNPTGAVYSRERLQAVLRTADAFGCLVVEDDYLRELRYDGGIAPPMKQMDESGRIILVKANRKLMPGQRIAYMAVPQELASRLALAKHTTNFHLRLLQQVVSPVLPDRRLGVPSGAHAKPAWRAVPVDGTGAA
jgi:2-aminoadipate transaminase